ncbi:hypothetical protein ILUMI_18801 [Ignelater luminosus]|uniref:Sodium-coupled monocarboxylate transporter 1 n=1 Tax=Ignelater luminosus TaxID=2038154 RepID=A0A8K0CLE0_IGNLU|nr:hypothetical protein ILUMI_18801 [Ignelater luminosus]
MSLICIFYTTIGGLKAVVWADTLQLCVTLCTLGCVLIMGTLSVGGFGSIWEKGNLGDRIELFILNPDPTIRNTFWSVLIGTTFVWTAVIGANPATAQRFLAVSSLSDAKKVLVVFVVCTIITKTICCFSGLIMYARYIDCDPLTAGYIKRPDQMLPYYVLDVAAQIPGLSGLFVAGLFSTALSTLSTYLNSLSGIIYTDLIYPLLPKKMTESRATIFMKIITTIIGLTSVALIFIVERLGTILELIGTLHGVTLGPLLGVFTMGMVFPFANKKGALFGIVGSLVIMTLIVVQYQIYTWNGVIKHSTKPLSVDGCNNPSVDLSRQNQNVTRIPSEEVFWLFRISFHYYVLIGTFLTLIIGLPISWFSQNDDLAVAPDTLSSCISQFFSKSLNSENEDVKIRADDLPWFTVGRPLRLPGDLPLQNLEDISADTS